MNVLCVVLGGIALHIAIAAAATAPAPLNLKAPLNVRTQLAYGEAEVRVA